MTATSEGTRLEGLAVTITGRLASMSREEAIERVALAGGAYVQAPSEDTALLVIGAGGPPLGEDGRPTQAIEEARRLQAEGADVRMIPEEEFLDLLGLHQRQADLHRHYTTEQLGRILGVPIGLIRAWVRHGLIRPVRTIGRLHWFDFQQVGNARSLLELARSGVTPGRIRKSLEQLSGWMQDTEHSLAQLAALENGGPLLVRLQDGRLAEPSGQLRLAFESPPEAGPARPPAALGADEWFERGVSCEDHGRLEDAAQAYREALRAGGRSPEVSFNLGNTLYALGRKQEAVRELEQATTIEPDYVEAWNNLGNVLCDLGRADEARAAYGRALAIAPDYADAHYNAAELQLTTGDLEGSRRHFMAYLSLDPGSSWAGVVRRRLAELDRLREGGPTRVVPLRPVRKRDGTT